MNLYELKGELLQLLELAEDEEIDEQALADTWEAVELEFEEKADAYGVIINKLQADILYCDNELNRIEDKKEKLVRNQERMVEALKEAMSETGKVKFTTEKFAFSVVKNGGMAPLIYTGDVPEEYKYTPIVEPKIDTKKIREALKEGELDFVHEGERGTHLTIK